MKYKIKYLTIEGDFNEQHIPTLHNRLILKQ